MKTPSELLEKLYEYDDIESWIALYIEARARESEFAEIKRVILARVKTELEKTGEVKGKTSFGASYGITQPKSKMRLNQAEWRQALDSDDALYKLVYDVEFQQKRLEYARKSYMEEYTPIGRIYIK